MTIYELHIALMDGIDKYFTLSTPELTIEMRDRILNRGIEKFVKQRYGGNNTKGLGFEEIQKRSDDLSSLVEYVKPTVAGAGFIQDSKVKSINYTLPTDYWFAIWERGLITVNGCPAQIETKDCNGNSTFTANTKQISVKVTPRRHNEIETICEDPFNRPEGDEGIFRVRYKTYMSVVMDKNVTMDEYHLGYIQSFQRLKNGVSYIQTAGALNWKTLEFWFPNHTHSEIVDIAVQSTLEVIEQPRINTHIQEINTQE